MLRAAAAAALLGVGLAIALSALHLTRAGPWALIWSWWPVVLVAAGVRGAVRPRILQRAWAAGMGLLGLALLYAHVTHLPAAPLLLAGLLTVAALRLVGFGRTRGATGTVRFAGDVRLGGPTWRVENSHIFQAVGEVHLDLTTARLPEGTTRLHVGMWAGEITVDVPTDLGVRAEGELWAGDLELLDHRAEGIGPRLVVESDGFAESPRRVHLTFDMLAGEVRLRRRG